MSHRKESFSDEELTTLATDIINDLQNYKPPIDPDFILFRNIDSTSYIHDEYIDQSLSPFMEYYNSCSTNNISPQYNSNNIIGKDSLTITPHISMDSNFSDSIPTLPPTPTFKSKLNIPKIKTYTFAGNKKNGIKQRLAKEKQNRKIKHKTQNNNNNYKKSPSSPFNPPPQHIPYISPKYSYTNTTSVDITSCVSPLETKKSYKQMQSAFNITEFNQKNKNKSSKSMKSNKKKKQKRRKNCKKNSYKKMSVKLDSFTIDINSIDLRKFTNPLSAYSPFYTRRNVDKNGEITSTTPVPRSKRPHMNRKCKVRANSVVSTRNPIWNNCDLY